MSDYRNLPDYTCIGLRALYKFNVGIVFPMIIFHKANIFQRIWESRKNIQN